MRVTKVYWAASAMDFAEDQILRPWSNRKDNHGSVLPVGRRYAPSRSGRVLTISPYCVSAMWGCGQPALVAFGLCANLLAEASAVQTEDILIFLNPEVSRHEYSS